MSSNVALSGWNFDTNVLKKLIDAGIFAISISLNESTERINSLSRNGYDYAINALKLLKENNYNNSILN